MLASIASTTRTKIENRGFGPTPPCQRTLDTMHIFDPLLALFVIGSVTMACSEACDNNWKGTAVGSFLTCVGVGAVALL